MWAKIQALVQREEADGLVKIYCQRSAVLYAYFLEIMRMVNVLAASVVMILLILWVGSALEGVVVPASAARCRRCGAGFSAASGI